MNQESRRKNQKINPLNISVQEMLNYSLQLWKKHKKEWSPLEAKYAKYRLLWLIGELGEVIDIIKKDGEKAIMRNQSVRVKLIEEITDCYMYLADTLNCYKVTSKKFSQIYHQKMQYNLRREYKKGKYLKTG